MLDLTILYRGPLSSCNYDCDYCPFAKHHETAAELARDRRALDCFVEWIECRPFDRFAVFFTPWGEALVRRWYQHSIARLSQMSHVSKIAIQTNLSCKLDWIEDCHRPSLGLWCTFHPTQTARGDFLAQCRRLDHAGVRYSVGMVGLHEYFPEAERMRKELSSDVYLWINAYKDVPDYYAADDIERWRSIDPWFGVNLMDYPFKGEACRAGEMVVSVDGDGTIRRCHFIQQPIGNIYQSDFEAALRPRTCTNETCGCHIGYVHMPALQLDDIYGDGILERIPREEVWSRLRQGNRQTSTLA